MKRTIEPFINGIVRLRLLEETDLEQTLSWRNRPEARMWFKTTDIIDYEQHQKWFRAYSEKDDDFLFVIEAEGKPVGQASIYNVDWKKKEAELGRFLAAPESVGQGYISMACSGLINFCFHRLGLSDLHLEVFETNQRAFNLYQKNGFTVAGRHNGLIKMRRSLDDVES